MCASTGGSTTQYFFLEQGAWQGDGISAYLFLLCLYILLLNIKNEVKMKELKFHTIATFILQTLMLALIESRNMFLL